MICSLWRAESSGRFSEVAQIDNNDPHIFIDKDLHPEQGIYRYFMTVKYKSYTSRTSDTLMIQYGRSFKWLNYFPVNSNYSTTAFISPDNRYIYTRTPSYIEMYDLASGALVRQMGKGEIGSFVLYNNGMRCVAIHYEPSSAYLLRIWDTQSGANLQSAKVSDSAYISRIVVNPAGTMVALVGPDSSIQIRSLSDLALQRSITNIGPISDIRKIIFSPDNSMLITLQWAAGTIHFYDIMTGERQRTVIVQGNHSSDLVFTKDGSTLLTCSGEEGIVNIWEYPSMRLQRSIALSTYNLACGNSGYFYLYWRGGVTARSLADPEFKQDFIAPTAGFAVSPDGSRFAVLNDKSVSLLSPDTESLWYRVY